jgi:hypothetical protein
MTLLNTPPREPGKAWMDLELRFTPGALSSSVGKARDALAYGSPQAALHMAVVALQYRVEAAGIRRQPPPRSGASVMLPIVPERRDPRRIRSQAHTKHPLAPV